MIRNTGKSSRAGGLLVLSLLTAACLTLSAFAAAGANAFTRTVTDIEDPAVNAKVLGLEVEAGFGFVDQQYFHGPGGSMLLSTVSWNHRLSGQTDASLTEAQMPKLTIQRDPTVVSLSGKVVTEEATGSASYGDFELCQGSRTTSKSPLLDVDLEGFYQSGTSSSTGNPAASVSTENLDPWLGSGCSNDQPRTTEIRTYSSQTATDLFYGGNIGTMNQRPNWFPENGGLTTTENGCAPRHCDFTISGSNVNSGSSISGTGSGEATTEFTLRLRLEYPEEPTAAPDTRITKAPRKLIRTKSGKARVAFRFGSTGPAGTKFKCRLDKGPVSSCASPFKRKVGPGKHRLDVISVYRGEADRTPAVHRWTVKKTSVR
ncbi:MAG TPA: hypothetical protein VMF31_06100 [Solirubrobacterales bacterium]|nr:hypothetical protein [Solirubrobacterales bacterium]